MFEQWGYQLDSWLEWRVTWPLQRLWRRWFPKPPSKQSATPSLIDQQMIMREAIGHLRNNNAFLQRMGSDAPAQTSIKIRMPADFKPKSETPT